MNSLFILLSLRTGRVNQTAAHTRRKGTSSLWVCVFIFVLSGELLAQSISTGTVTGPLCGSSRVDVPYSYTGGTPSGGNQFIAELSDANGSFSAATQIGSYTGTLTSWTVSSVIPSSVTQGSGYRIRIRSTSPAITGSPSAAFVINEVYSGSSVFGEGMGSSASAVSVLAHEAANAFDNDGYTMSSTGGTNVRVINASPQSAGYSGASGQGAIRMNGSGTFTISGINSTGLSNPGLGLGILKSTTGATGAEISVAVSADGINFTNLSYTALPTGSGTNSTWYYRVFSGTIPSSANLRIRVTHSGGGVTYHLDDMALASRGAASAVALSPAAAQNICNGTSITLSATAVAAASYIWSDGSTSSGTNVSVTGNYSADVSDLFGCRVSRGPVAVTTGASFAPSVNVSVSPGSSVCSGQLVTFTATPVNGGVSPSYQWQRNGSNVGSNNAVYSASDLASGDQISVVMTSGLVCASPASATSTAITMTVTPSVTPLVSMDANPGFTICEGASVSFAATPVNGGSSPVYQWKKNGVNVGSNSPLYSDDSLVQGDQMMVTLTSNETCALPATVNSSTAVITVNSRPSAMITSGETSVCSLSPVATIVINASGNGAFSGTLNPGGIPFSGSGPDIGVDVSPAMNTTYTLASLSDSYCTAQSMDLSGSVLVSVTEVFTCYEDSDEDGYGNSSASLQVCGGIPFGYTADNTDCDDTDETISPGNEEIANGVDDDCDGLIDEGFNPVNDTFAAAAELTVSPLGMCVSTTGTLVGATISPEAGGTVNTGEDVWYWFTAVSPAIRVECITDQTNVMMELQTASGALLDTENAVTVPGTEYLNYNGLTMGATYYLRIRNYNRNQGTAGSFSLCVRRLMASGANVNMNTGPGPYSTCGFLQALQRYASFYTFTFTSTTAPAPLSGPHVVVANSLPGLSITPLSSMLPGLTYQVSVSCTYNLLDGAGQAENITLPDPASSSISIVHSDVVLSPADRCPRTKVRGQGISANTFPCGASFLRWRFTPVTGGASIEVDGAIGTRSVSILQLIALGLTTGQYNVQIQPRFNGGNFPGTFGPVGCFQLSAKMILEEDDGDEMSDLSAIDEMLAAEKMIIDPEFSLFPNPATTDYVNIRLNDQGIGRDGRLTLRETSGRISRQWFIQQDAQFARLDLSGLATGYYLLQVDSVSGSRSIPLVISR